MTPQDTCENVRNIVFEILRRRYPETMPTKWYDPPNGQLQAIHEIRLRGELAFRFIVSPRCDEWIACRAFAPGGIDNMTDYVLVYDGKIMFTKILGLIAYATAHIYYDELNQIADEFGMGVEQ